MPDKEQKAMIVRLPTDLAADLDGVAKVNRIPVAEAVRQAISDQIEVRRGDAEFKARIQRLVDENQEILDRLAGLAGVAEPRYLDLADFLLIAEAVLRVPAAELALSARLPLAESALAAPARTHAHRRLAYIDRHVLPVGEHAETVSLLDSTGATIQTCTYGDAWFPSTDGPGWSMVVRDENAPAPNLNTAAAWALSFQRHGNPGGPNGPVFSTEFEGWRQQNFTAAELDDPLISGPDATRDGLSNQLRYALGLTPSQGAASSLPTASLNGPQIDFSYRRLKNPLDLEYAPESSTDLTSWLADSVPVSVTDNGDGTETVVVRFTAGSRKYLRLSVTGTP